MALTDKQSRAVELLILGTTVVKVAKEMEVSEQTLHKWKKKPEFVEALTQAKKEAIKKAQLVFSVKAEYAAKRLVEMIDDKDATTVQFKAATFVYSSAIGGTIEDFEERLLQIEESVTREV